MKIQIGGTTIKLNNREVASCKKIVSKFINAVQKETDEKKNSYIFFYNAYRYAPYESKYFKRI